MNTFQKICYACGIGSAIMSAYSGIYAVSAYQVDTASTELMLAAAYLRPVGIGITALAFAVLALACFKAGEK
jgi:hypothetical protein